MSRWLRARVASVRVVFGEKLFPHDAAFPHSLFFRGTARALAGGAYARRGS